MYIIHDFQIYVNINALLSHIVNAFVLMEGAEYVAVLENANFACWVHVLWKCFINAVR